MIFHPVRPFPPLGHPIRPEALISLRTSEERTVAGPPELEERHFHTFPSKTRVAAIIEVALCPLCYNLGATPQHLHRTD